MRATVLLPIVKEFDAYVPRPASTRKCITFSRIYCSAKSITAFPGKNSPTYCPGIRKVPPPKWFGFRSIFTLMFLKSYLNVSVRQLIERFDTDWSLQYFCEKVLSADQQVRNLTIVTRIRAYIEPHCDWERVQEVLMAHWKRDGDNRSLPVSRKKILKREISKQRTPAFISFAKLVAKTASR